MGREKVKQEKLSTENGAGYFLRKKGVRKLSTDHTLWITCW